MRLINKKQVIDGIVDYWSGIATLSIIETGANEMRMKAREKSYLIFDNKFYTDSIVTGNRFIAGNPVLMTTDKNIIKEFGNRVAHLRNLLKGTYTRYLKAQMGKADLLIKNIDSLYRHK